MTTEAELRAEIRELRRQRDLAVEVARELMRGMDDEQLAGVRERLGEAVTTDDTGCGGGREGAQRGRA
jgi:hypothetical protein